MSSTGAQAPLFELRDVGVCFPSVEAAPVQAVAGLSFSVQRGSFLSLLGPSGCGKSTALNVLAGLIAPTQGSALYEGSPLRGLSRKLGYIAQEDTLLPWYTVLQNVALGGRLHGKTRADARAQAQELLETMGLADFATLFPHELSGGMKKRAMIARVLATEPEVLLMDEPFAPLDAFTREKLQEEILQLQAKSGQTIVYVTHDIAEAVCLSDRVLLFGGRPGRVVESFSIPLPRPRRLEELRFEPAALEQQRKILAALRALPSDSSDAETLAQMEGGA